MVDCLPVVPRWLKTYYFLSLDGAEFDSLIAHKYTCPFVRSKKYTSMILGLLHVIKNPRFLS